MLTRSKNTSEETNGVMQNQAPHDNKPKIDKSKLKRQQSQDVKNDNNKKADETTKNSRKKGKPIDDPVQRVTEDTVRSLDDGDIYESVDSNNLELEDDKTIIEANRLKLQREFEKIANELKNDKLLIIKSKLLECYEHEMEERNNQFLTEKEILVDEIRELTEKCTHLENRIKIEINNAKKLIDDCEIHEKDYKELIDKQKNRITVIEKEKENLQVTLEFREDEIEKLKQELLEIKKKNRTIVEKNQEYKDKNEDLQFSLIAMRKTIDELNHSIRNNTFQYTEEDTSLSFLETTQTIQYRPMACENYHISFAQELAENYKTNEILTIITSQEEEELARVTTPEKKHAKHHTLNQRKNQRTETLTPTKRLLKVKKSRNTR